MIRPLEYPDRDAVLRINAAAAGAVFRLDAREFDRLLTIAAGHLAAVGPDGVVRGYLLAFRREDGYDGEEFLHLRDTLGRSFVYIDQVAIDPRWRGAGLGRRLYEELATRARNQDVHVLCCEVNTAPPNPASAAFHRRLGFREIGSLATRDGRVVALLQRDAADSA